MFNSFRFLVVVLIFLSASFGFSSQRVTDPTVSIMSYNVENLFDAIDDGANQGDPAFLPMHIKRTWKGDPCNGIGGYFGKMCRELDWTDAKYKKRLEQLADILLSYNNHGADIIFLYEIENKRVMHDLWQQHLVYAGYRRPFHHESPSFRGIDVGVISRLPMAENPVAHVVDLGDFGKSTRDIIEVTYRLQNGARLKIAGNHWPSLGSPTETRLRAADIVRDISDKAILQDIPFVAVGDFNTLPNENPNPITKYLADKNLNNLEVPMVDLQNYLNGFSTFPYSGTHFYQGRWDPLDRILLSKDILLESGDFGLVKNSFDVFWRKDMLTNIDPATGEKLPYLFPYRHDFFTGKGFSDHMPLVIKLKYY